MRPERARKLVRPFGRDPFSRVVDLMEKLVEFSRVNSTAEVERVNLSAPRTGACE
jgi:hypothetical protein